MGSGAQPDRTETGHQLLTVEDRMAIHELIALHGHLADDHRSDDLDQFLTADAVYDLRAFGFGQVEGLPAIRRLHVERPGNQPVGHHVTNVLVSPGPDGTAVVRSKGLSVMADGTAGTCVYDDQVVRTAAGWRLRHRRISIIPAD